MANLDKLLAISSDAFNCDAPHIVGDVEYAVDTLLLEELLGVLSRKNGFLAFESALHVFPASDSPWDLELNRWNQPSYWRYHYDLCEPDLLFFAQDVFGGQFGISKSGIIRFDPESGEIREHSHTLDEWASHILQRYNSETGWQVAHDWQARHRPLSADERLLPKIPFVLGGDYAAENVVAVPTKDVMHWWGRLHRQIRNVPDGTRVTIEDWIK